jgi:hypothetical protein
MRGHPRQARLDQDTNKQVSHGKTAQSSSRRRHLNDFRTCLPHESHHRGSHESLNDPDSQMDRLHQQSESEERQLGNP